MILLLLLLLSYSREEVGLCHFLQYIKTKMQKNYTKYKNTISYTEKSTLCLKYCLLL